MLGGARSGLTDSVCLFQGSGPRSAGSLVQVARQPPAAPCTFPELPFCCLKRAGPQSIRSPAQVATASRRPDTAAPSPFCLASDICARLPASYLDTQHWRCSFVEIQMYLPASQADLWVFRMVW